MSDVTTCPHCVDVATGWNRDIRAGALVVLVDSDMNRENPTAPAGLPLYGFLAAARNDAAERFETLYPLLMNVNHVPEARRYYPRSGDYAAYFADLLRRVAHRSIVWHSERPTAWDRWLGRRLGELGGTTSTFATPLSAGGGFRVETPPSADEAVIRLLASLEKPPPIDPRPCVSPRVVSRQQLPFQANALAPVDIPTDDVPATWFALSWNDVWSAHGGWHLPAIRHVAGGPREIGTLRADGIGERLSWPTRASLRTERLVDLLPIGWGCATVAGGEWWVVDPERGTLHSHASHEWLPPGEWIGVTSDRADELILAAADQRIVVADIRTRAVRAEFPAAIMPSRLESFGECSQIVRGRDWIGVYRAPGAAVDFYTPDGRPSGTLDLESNGFTFIRAVSAADTFLAVTDGLEWLTTLRIDVKPCASP